MILNFKIGCDPELFIEKAGKIISAEGLIGGTKYEPKLISNLGHAVQEDNIMAEFNIPASNTAEDFTDNINFVKNYLDTLLELLKCKINYSASAIIDKKYLNTGQARLFGCDPDYNVYLKDINPSPNSEGNLRTCGKIACHLM